jgi:hypothetical protein
MINYTYCAENGGSSQAVIKTQAQRFYGFFHRVAFAFSN